MPDPAILVLAAGLSRRMGGLDKLLELVDGELLLARVVRRAAATGAGVIVCLPADNQERALALGQLDVVKVPVANPAFGLAESLRVGLSALRPAQGVMLVLGDLPDLTTADMAHMLRVWRDCPDLILRGTASDGTPGHPVCLPGWLVPALATLQGDIGARDILRTCDQRVRLVGLPDRHAITDLDTPADWTAWRAARDNSRDSD